MSHNLVRVQFFCSCCLRNVVDAYRRSIQCLKSSFCYSTLKLLYRASWLNIRYMYEKGFMLDIGS